MARALREGVKEDIALVEDIAKSCAPSNQVASKRKRAIDAVESALIGRHELRNNMMMFRELFEVAIQTTNSDNVIGDPAGKELMCQAVRMIAMTLQFAAYGDDSRIPFGKLGGYESLCKAVPCPEMLVAMDKAIEAGRNSS